MEGNNKRTGSAQQIAIGCGGSLARASFHLMRAAIVLTVNFSRVLLSKLSLPLLHGAERLGNAAKSAEKKAAEYERKIREQESRLD